MQYIDANFLLQNSVTQKQPLNKFQIKNLFVNQIS